MTRERGMSVWRSPSGLHHWLRRCSGGGGVLKVRRATISRSWLAENQYAHTQVCRCLRDVTFEPGKRARN